VYRLLLGSFVSWSALYSAASRCRFVSVLLHFFHRACHVNRFLLFLPDRFSTSIFPAKVSFACFHAVYCSSPPLTARSVTPVCSPIMSLSPPARFAVIASPTHRPVACVVARLTFFRFFSLHHDSDSVWLAIWLFKISAVNRPGCFVTIPGCLPRPLSADSLRRSCRSQPPAPGRQFNSMVTTVVVCRLTEGCCCATAIVSAFFRRFIVFSSRQDTRRDSSRPAPQFEAVFGCSLRRACSGQPPQRRLPCQVFCCLYCLSLFYLDYV